MVTISNYQAAEIYHTSHHDAHRDACFVVGYCDCLVHTEPASGILHTVRSGFQTVTGTMQSAGSWISFPFKVIGNALDQTQGASDEQLTKLQAENEELRATVIQLEEYRQENKRLSSLLQTF